MNLLFQTKNPVLAFRKIVCIYAACAIFSTIPMNHDKWSKQAIHYQRVLTNDKSDPIPIIAALHSSSWDSFTFPQI